MGTESEFGEVLEGVGEVVVRTEQDILDGRFGNGVPSVEMVQDAQRRRKVERDRRKSELEDAYMRGVQEALSPAGEYIGDLVVEARGVLEKYRESGRISNAEVAIMKMGMKAAEDIANRQFGKPTTRTETTSESSVLSMILEVSGDANQS